MSPAATSKLTSFTPTTWPVRENTSSLLSPWDSSFCASEMLSPKILYRLRTLTLGFCIVGLWLSSVVTVYMSKLHAIDITTDRLSRRGFWAWGKPQWFVDVRIHRLGAVKMTAFVRGGASLTVPLRRQS